METNRIHRRTLIEVLVLLILAPGWVVAGEFANVSCELVNTQLRAACMEEHSAFAIGARETISERALKDRRGEELPTEVQVKNDRFKQETVVSLSPQFTRLGIPDLHATATLDGSTLKSLSVYFILGGSQWTYLRCHNVDWLADNIPVAMPPAEHHGEVAGGGVIELIRQQPITVDILDRLSTSRATEYRICTDERKLTDFEQRNLRVFDRVVHSFLDSPH